MAHETLKIILIGLFVVVIVGMFIDLARSGFKIDKVDTNKTFLK